MDWSKFLGGSNIRVRKILDFVTLQNIYDPEFFDRPSRFIFNFCSKTCIHWWV